MTININSRYYLAPTPAPLGSGFKDFDVYDRARELCFKPAIVFSNGSEAECREWVLRNTEEPVEHSKGPWIYGHGGDSLLRVYSQRGKSGNIVCAFGDGFDEDQRVFQPKRTTVNAALIATSPKLLALLEQYHKAMPTKESGQLIAEARGWTTEGGAK